MDKTFAIAGVASVSVGFSALLRIFRFCLRPNFSVAKSEKCFKRAERPTERLRRRLHLPRPRYREY